MSEYSTRQLLDVIREALEVGDMRGVAAGLRMLAVQSPRDAEAILAALDVAGRAPYVPLEER